MPNKQVVIDYVANTASAIAGSQKVGAEAEKAHLKVKSSADIAGGGLKSLFGNLEQLGSGVGMAALGWAGLGAVLIGSTKAAMDAEVAQSKLTSAIAKNPAAGTAKDMEDLATATMHLTTQDDEAVKGAEAFLIQAGHTKDEIRILIPLIADYAAASGKDMVSAAQSVEKALHGKTKALQDVGIYLDAASIKGREFDSVTNALANTIGGRASAETETAAGKMKQLGNAFGEIQEAIGTALLPLIKDLAGVLMAVQPVAQAVADGVGKIDKNVRSLVGGLKDLGNLGFKNLLDPGGEAKGRLDEINKGMDELDLKAKEMEQQQIKTWAAGSAGTEGVSQKLLNFLGLIKGSDATITAVADNYVKAAKDMGISLDGDAIKAAALTQAHRNLGGANQESAAAINEHNKAIDEQALKFADDKTAIDDTIGSLHALWDAQHRGEDAAYDLITATSRLTQSQENLRKAHLDVDKANHDVNSSQAKVNQLEQDGKRDTEEYAGAVTDLNEKKQTAADKTSNLESSSISLLKAQGDLKQQMIDSAVVWKNSGDDFDTVAARINDMGHAAGMSQADIDGVIRRLRDEWNPAVRSADTAEALRGALADLEARYHNLTGAIRGSIGALYDYDNTVAAVSPSYNIGGKVRAMAAGGTAHPGEWFTVGEAGMELAHARPGGGVDIFPNRGGGGGGGGQPIINIYGVQNPVIVGSEVRRQLASARRTVG